MNYIITEDLSFERLEGSASNATQNITFNLYTMLTKDGTQQYISIDVWRDDHEPSEEVKSCST